jgi:two-component system chemotaxis response regulator CheY
MVTTVKQKKQPAAKVDKKGVPIPNLKVLVVEDFETMRKAVVKVLTSLDMKVIEASNGIEALKILDSESVDIVFSDLVMPEMDGFELCEEIRRRPNIRHVPVIIISTHRDAHYVVRALRCGADDYLTKPFKASVAKRIVERVTSNV